MPIRILIADDHELIRHGLRAVLAREPDIEIIGDAVNGAVAVAKSAECSPDIVLMDIRMPVMDGCEATRQIKINNPDTRVLILTSNDSKIDMFAALAAGADGYCLKDTHVTELILAIRTVHAGASWLDPQIAQLVLRSIGTGSPSGTAGSNSVSGFGSESGLGLAGTASTASSIFTSGSASGPGSSSNSGSRSAPSSGFSSGSPVSSQGSGPTSTKSQTTKESDGPPFGLSPREIEVLSLLVEGLNNTEIAEKLVISADTVKTHMKHIMGKLQVNDRTKAAIKAIREGIS
ncbi:MAG: response regulator transcription factor [Candidatus Melainabacteria bacterium]|nr:response regulator transcription factor [Candidatus Melainabacteria bacterium]